MKKTLAIVLALVMVLALAACKGTTPDQPVTPDQPSGELAGTYDIKVWCADNIVDLTKKQIEDFNANNEFGIKFNATVEPVGEGDAATQMITDVEAGGDIFCFAQDQFARLVAAGALAKLGEGAAKIVKEQNVPESVAAVTVGTDLYAYPLTADNGYFMYYDKSVIPEEDLGSLEKLIADCEAAQKYFSMENETSAWYLASWFFGTGCVSDWKLAEDGVHFESVHDTFNSPEGLIAVKGMKKLLDSPFYTSASDVAGFSSNCAIVVSGTWGYTTAAAALGDNLGAAELPSFEVDGKTYHMGSFNGYKLMGVKPQTDANKAAALHKLAQYLTSEQGQLERFDAVAWGPSNTVALANEKVQANPAIAAVVAQGAYATPQGQIHGSWWDIAKVIGTDVKEAKDEAGLQKALDNYEAAISDLFELTGYIFVGAWGDWNNASLDYKMEEADGKMSITLDVPQSDYMGGRIVLAGTWDTDMGYSQVTTGKELMNPEMDPANGNNNDNNIVFAEAGNYTVTVDMNTKEITIVKN